MSNYTLMLDMIQYCRRLTAEEILQLPDVGERVDRYFAQEIAYTDMLKKNSACHGDLLVIDLRNVEDLQVGNRFKEYALFPQQDVSLRIIWGQTRDTVVFTCGHSVLKRTSTVNVGELMLKYGGGGHTRVGTCQVPAAEAAQVKAELIAAITAAPVCC